jgi:hypothetical protein
MFKDILPHIIHEYRRKIAWKPGKGTNPHEYAGLILFD